MSDSYADRRAVNEMLTIIRYQLPRLRKDAREAEQRLVIALSKRMGSAAPGYRRAS